MPLPNYHTITHYTHEVITDIHYLQVIFTPSQSLTDTCLLSERLVRVLRHGVTSGVSETFGCSDPAQPPSATWTGPDLRLPACLYHFAEKI
jgi:hypothetical protein